MASLEDREIATQPLTNKHKVKRGVNLLSGITLIVGVIIGSSIFIPPKGFLTQTELVGMRLVVWAGCGILALLGGSTVILESRAEHSYLFVVFGPLPAFLYSWTLALIIRPYSLSVVALTFAHYVSQPFYTDHEISPNPTRKILAATCLVLTMLINCVSAKWAMRIQNLVSFGKHTALKILIVIGLIEVGSGNLHNFKGSFDGSTLNLANIELAFYLGLWAHGGWNSLNFVTEEMKNPARDLPRALRIGIPLIIIIYLLTNIAYFANAGGQSIFNSGAVAMVIGEEKMSPVAWLIPIFAACSTFGCVNGLAFSGARLVSISARNGHMPKVFAVVHKTCHTPMFSIIFLHVIAMIMLIPDSGEFSILFNGFSFAAWLSYFAVITALMYLKWKHPDAKRPYKVWLIVLIVANLAVLYLLITSFWQEPKESAMAPYSIVLGIPVYFFCSKDAWDGFSASSVSQLYSELACYIEEELKCVQDDLLSLEEVCSKVKCEMLTAMLSDHEEEVKSLKEDLHVLDGFHSEATMKKEDLLALLGKGEDIDGYLNKLNSDLRCLSEVEDWRKTDQDRAKKNRVVKLIAAIHQQSPRVKND